jgi:hypothetical protein
MRGLFEVLVVAIGYLIALANSMPEYVYHKYLQVDHRHPQVATYLRIYPAT